MGRRPARLHPQPSELAAQAWLQTLPELQGVWVTTSRGTASKTREANSKVNTPLDPESLIDPRGGSSSTTAGPQPRTARA
jgi:hypothetical protein